MTPTGPLARLFRRTGADLPGGDPRPSHGAEMEGYFWRITDPATDQVVVALCGINRHPDGDWATVAMATHPEERVVNAAVSGASASPEVFSVAAASALTGNDRALDVDLGTDTQLHVEFDDGFAWPLRLGGGGIFSVAPFLNQYWHPHLLGATCRGHAVIAGRRVELDGATVYAEKNWGRGFPRSWWWGQAQGFSRDDVCVVFTGGVLSMGPLAAQVGGVVVRIGPRVMRFAPPLSIVRSRADGDRWQVRARRGGVSVTIDARPRPGARAAMLAVPDPPSRRQALTDLEHLAGHLDQVVQEGSTVLFAGSTELAGLEIGYRPDEAALAGWGSAEA